MLGKDLISQSVFNGFLGIHPVVAIGIFFDLRELLTSVLCHDFVEEPLEAYRFTKRDFHVGNLALGAGTRLVDHNP